MPGEVRVGEAAMSPQRRSEHRQVEAAIDCSGRPQPPIAVESLVEHMDADEITRLRPPEQCERLADSKLVGRRLAPAMVTVGVLEEAGAIDCKAHKDGLGTGDDPTPKLFDADGPDLEVGAIGYSTVMCSVSSRDADPALDRS